MGQPNKSADDPSLAHIRALYRRLRSIPLADQADGRRPGGPAYHALVQEIRAAVDERKRIVGDEMVLVAWIG